MNNKSFGPFHIWAKKKFGVVSIVPVDMRAVLRRFFGGFPRLALANAAEGWHPEGNLSVYPIDYTLYTTRYLLVSFAAAGAGAALVSAGFAWAASVPDGKFVNLYPTSRLPIPLGIVTDEITSPPDVAPFGVNCQLLGGGQRRTSQAVTDGVVPFDTLLVGSATTAGYVTSLPATPGSYWSPGLSLTTSEGAGALIEFDPRPQIVNVGVIT